MLLKFLRHVRSQPKPVRNQYALGISATFTAIVALIWIFTGMSLRSDESYADVSQRGNTPFSSLVNQIKDQASSVFNSVEPVDVDLANGLVESAEATTDPRELKLSPDSINTANDNNKVTASSTESNTTTIMYQEVLIGTTSSQTGSSTSR